MIVLENCCIILSDYQTKTILISSQILPSKGSNNTGFPNHVLPCLVRDKYRVWWDNRISSGGHIATPSCGVSYRGMQCSSLSARGRYTNNYDRYVLRGCWPTVHNVTDPVVSKTVATATFTSTKSSSHESPLQLFSFCSVTSSNWISETDFIST